jgi:DNA repair exonuclease SbcCD ATPase subunit
MKAPAEHPQNLAWSAALLLPENAVWLEKAARTLPIRLLSSNYRKWFESFPQATDQNRGRLLLKKPIRDAQDSDVIAALESLRSKDTKFLEGMVNAWLKTHTPTMELLQEHRWPENLEPTTLEVCQWLLGDTIDVRKLLSNIAEQLRDVRKLVSDRDTTLESSLAEKRVLQQQLEETKRNLGQLQTELTQEREQKDAALQVELQRFEFALEGEQEKSRAEIFRLQDGFTKKEQNAQSNFEQQKERWASEKQRLEVEVNRHRNDAESISTELERVQSAHANRQTNSDTRIEALASELRQTQTQLEDAQQQYERSNKEATAAQTELETMQKRMAELEQARQSQSLIDSDEQIGEAALQGALLIKYAKLGSAPQERLAELFCLYRAFSKGEFDDERLEHVTNIKQFADQEPTAIMMTGLKQMLEDGTLLALDRVLDSRLVKRESMFQQLVNHLESSKSRSPQ